MSDNLPYVQFPLSLMRSLDKEKIKTLNKIIHYGIYRFAVQACERADEPDLYDAIRNAGKPLGMTIGGDIEYIIREAEKVEDDAIRGEPYPMISTKSVFMFRNNDKNDFEMMQFRLKVAINSILGKKPYFKVNKGLLFARMFGYNKESDMPLSFRKSNMQYQKYFARHNFNRLLDEMELNWHIVKLPVAELNLKVRGMWIGRYSTKEPKALIISEMAKVAIEQNRKYRLNRLKAENKEICQRALKYKLEPIKPNDDF